MGSFQKPYLVQKTKQALDNEKHSFLEQADTGKNQWWTYLLGILVVLFFSQLLGILPSYLYLDFAAQGELSSEEFEYFLESMNFDALGLDRNIGLLTLIASFGLGIVGLYITIKFIHNRTFVSLIIASKKIKWKRLSFGILVWGGMSIIYFAVDLALNYESYEFQLVWKSFVPLVLICLFFLPLQTSFEEFLFRGYYLQAFKKISRYPIVPMVATSFLFSLAHMLNPEVAAFGWKVMFIFYFLFGFMLALVTVLSNGLEIALGVHAVHNALSAITVTYEDAVIHTDAIWRLNDMEFAWSALLVSTVMFFVFLYFTYKYLNIENKQIPTDADEEVVFN